MNSSQVINSTTNNHGAPCSAANSSSNSNGGNGSFLDLDCDSIPIFTDQFLEHNRQREAELRQLRKTTTDLEEQNATLSKHIETMNAAIEKLESEFIQQRSSQALANQRLTRMRQLLYAAFADTPLPGTNELPTLPTIDTFVNQLQNKLRQLPSPSPEAEQIQAKVASVLTKLDL